MTGRWSSFVDGARVQWVGADSVVRRGVILTASNRPRPEIGPLLKVRPDGWSEDQWCYMHPGMCGMTAEPVIEKLGRLAE